MEEKDPVQAVRAYLTWKLHIDLEKNPIEARMEEGAIVIEGFVDDISQKKRAVLFAMGLEGASGVVDRLRVRPAKHMTDDEIRIALRDAIDEENCLTGQDINFEVNDGVVDIEGRVHSLLHKRLAGVLAWWVPGSTDVINSIEVEPPEEDSDDELKEALRIVLEKDRIVEADAITISVRDWVVTLGGYVPSEEQKKAAGEDAWYLWGVNDVVNNIETP